MLLKVSKKVLADNFTEEVGKSVGVSDDQIPWSLKRHV